jgi:hypothetical protein
VKVGTARLATCPAHITDPHIGQFYLISVSFVTDTWGCFILRCDDRIMFHNLTAFTTALFVQRIAAMLWSDSRMLLLHMPHVACL